MFGLLGWIGYIRGILGIAKNALSWVPKKHESPNIIPSNAQGTPGFQYLVGRYLGFSSWGQGGKESPAEPLKP